VLLRRFDDMPLESAQQRLIVPEQRREHSVILTSHR
jgi:hypothetical protein